MNIKHYNILEQKDAGPYLYIKANYAVEPFRCGNKECHCTFFTHQKGIGAKHKIFFVYKNVPTVLEVTRERYKCNGRECGRTFYADACETLDWNYDISPNFRNRVINYWINDREVSIRKAARKYGIGMDYIVNWENTIADAFYPLVNILPEDYLYFGAFNCANDPTRHGFVIAPEEDVPEEGKRHIAFIRDYSREGFLAYEQKRFLDTDKVYKIRYDYAPGIRSALAEIFGNAMLIVNRTRFRYYIEDLIHTSDADLTSILSPSDKSKEEIYGELNNWVKSLPAETPNRDAVLRAVYEMTETWDLYESFSEPSIPAITEPIRSDIDRLIGKKASFNSIMLKIMYENNDFKEKIKNAGADNGFTMSFSTGGFKIEDLMGTKEFKFTGKERIPWYGVDLNSIPSDNIDDNPDEE